MATQIFFFRKILRFVRCDIGFFFTVSALQSDHLLNLQLTQKRTTLSVYFPTMLIAKKKKAFLPMNEVPMTTTCFPFAWSAILLASSGVLSKQTFSKSMPGRFCRVLGLQNETERCK